MEDEIVQEYHTIIKKKIADKRFDSALQSALKLTQHYPEDALGHYYKGICYFAAEDYEMATMSYEEAIKQDIRFAKAYFNLGLCYFTQKYYEKALLNVGIALIFFTKQNEKPYKKRCIEAIKSINEERLEDV